MVDQEAKRAVLLLLARGEITLAEAAQLAGISRQLAAKWVRSSGVQWKRFRHRRLADRYRKVLNRGPKLVETESP